MASIAVIGMGPRGTAVVERIGANAALLADEPLHLHLIDPHPHGAGRIWHDAQSRELVMNTVAGEIGLFTDPTLAIDGPIRPGPNLYEWSLLAAGRQDAEPSAAFTDFPTGADALDAGLRAEVAAMKPWSHPSRVLYGRYLAWCLERAIHALPDTVVVHRHRSEAVAIDGSTPCRVVLSDGASIEADSAILALGWLGSESSDTDAALGRAVEELGLTFIPPASPIEQDLDRLQPGERVIVRGLGMGFFDLMALVTLGRGGRFVPDDDRSGRLRYVPSGREPRLHVGSRSGIPFRSKPLWGGFAPRTPQRHLAGIGRPDRPVDFAAEALPLIRKDAAVAYYSTLARVRPEAIVDHVALLAVLDEYDTDSDLFAAAVARQVPDPADRFDLDRLVAPARGRRFADPDAWRAWIRDYLDEDLREGAFGAASPLKAAAWSIGCARGPMWGIAGFGGLWGESHTRDFLRFTALGNLLGSGPPAFRSQQFRALIDAGIVNPIGPELTVRVDPQAGCLVAESAVVTGSGICATALVDAWMQAPRATGSTSPLLRSLVADGLARPFRILGRDGTAHETGAVEIGADDSRLVAADGSVDRPIFLLGIPAEEIRGNGTASPIPGAGGVFLREADAATRAALRAATRTPERV
ncbi:FAD/NAD(P)-binding protein [Microbacteriaceae bacterium VKM Ac-2854]|nr:FAD/NAD(P)-binding protein [Microbacteriaceae bacterium VKM Ac-2854]